MPFSEDEDDGLPSLKEWLNQYGLTKENIDQACEEAESIFMPNHIGRDEAEIREAAEEVLKKRES